MATALGYNYQIKIIYSLRGHKLVFFTLFLILKRLLQIQTNKSTYKHKCICSTFKEPMGNRVLVSDFCKHNRWYIQQIPLETSRLKEKPNI